MNRFRVFGLSAALAISGGSPALAADPPENSTLMKKLFGPPAPKPVGPTVKTGTPQRPVTIAGPLPAEQLTEALRAEQDAYLRRVSVCTELRRIAVERGDDALVRQADELERQAGALYGARVAALGVSRTKAPLPEPSVASRGTTDPIATDSSATRMAANRLLAPTAPVPINATAQARDIPPREVKP
jgi:hypothetical protein